MDRVPFSRRFIDTKGKLIGDDFPSSARIALSYLFLDLKNKWYLTDEKEVFLELNRIGRLTTKDLDSSGKNSFIDHFSSRIIKLTWDQVYTFCERAFQKFLRPSGNDYEENYISLDEVQKYFIGEINQLLDEENLAYHFENGEFRRRGRAQTQKAMERAGAVLSDPRLEKVKKHFNKAKKYFDARPQPDLENCVKDSLCALEAAVEIFTSKPASKDFEKAIKQLEGNDVRQIPAPIAQSMIKIYSYRGSGQGVAHAALQGNRVAIEDVELVLSLTADFITYLANLFPLKEEIPF